MQRSRGQVDAERRDAFARFTQSRLERAYRLAGVILRDASEAEDAVHDAAVQAWLHWGELRDPGRFDAWFDRIVVNECRARLRRRRVVPVAIVVDGLRSGAGTSASDPMGVVAERERMHRALATLDADHRIAVVLRYVSDLEISDIAARTGTAEGTVKSRLHYARQQLRAALEADDRTPGGSR
jgi:RNA polymerase sigma-70 factor (ECF subfamily)